MRRFTKAITALFLIVATLAVTECKKDTDPNSAEFKIVKEYLDINATSASITGSFEYPDKINSIKVAVGQRHDFTDAHSFLADIHEKEFEVTLTGLTTGTEYRYRYEVDYGSSKPFITEAKTFTTQSESPTVKTLEVLAMDSTTFRIKCEVLSDGGQEVTERGICWNTFGDPTMDDGTLQHPTGGLGQYTIRMENLALGKKYYVRAYAKNAAGKIGLSEEVLDFKTEAPAGASVDIELSCNPEVGGTASGGGSYEVGTQCTVTAEANSGYTFVNWTENGNQVSSETIYTFTVTTGRNLVANFTNQSYVITADVTPDNSGTVTGAHGYNYGEECTLTATANNGYDFVKWTKNGNTVSNTSSYTFTVTESANYVAHFSIKSYSVSVSANPTNGGTVSGGGTFDYGESRTVHATPADGFAFTNWTDDGDMVSSNANYTFTVTSNRNLVANFIYNGGSDDHAYVDLGLASGLLWATCNVGADNPEDYGDYFAWGETQPKDYYDWSTYQYCNGNSYTLTKYCNNSSYGYNGFTDNLTILEPSDDAATAQWGSGWRMPTKEEWQALLNMTVTWTTQNGVNGRLIIGTNGNSLFLPAAGEFHESSLNATGSYGDYWSSSLSSSNSNAWYLDFNSQDCVMYGGYIGIGRDGGRSVRAVHSAK